jgi:hypothetical protein
VLRGMQLDLTKNDAATRELAAKGMAPDAPKSQVATPI